MTKFPRENGMSAYTSIEWLAAHQADMKFRDGECVVTAQCPADASCVIAARAKGSPGAALVSACYKAAFEHESTCLAKKAGAPA